MNRVLEPTAYNTELEYESTIQRSIAISLKRIADVLDGTAIGICVTETIFNPMTVQNREVRS